MTATEYYLRWGPDPGKPVSEWRRYNAGLQRHMDGLEFRVRPGTKDGNPHDLVLEWRTPTGWRPVTFHTLGYIVDFLYENEHVLYPPADGYAGGEKLVAYMKRAIGRGADRASEELDREKQNSSRKQGAA